MANGTINLPAVQNANPTLVSRLVYGAWDSNDSRLFGITAFLAPEKITQTGFDRYQVVFAKDRIILYGHKPDDTWTTFTQIYGTST